MTTSFLFSDRRDSYRPRCCHRQLGNRRSSACAVLDSPIARAAHAAGLALVKCGCDLSRAGSRPVYGSLEVRKSTPNGVLFLFSDRRDSNPRLPPWQGGALPTEPLSHKSTVVMLSQPVRNVNRQQRVMGIEPTFSAWKADVLPLNHTRAYIGVTGFEPATPWSQTRCSSQTEPHPGHMAIRVIKPETQNILYNRARPVSTIFSQNFPGI